MSVTPSKFPKTSRILRRSEFRIVYDRGVRVSGQYFAAFCLALENREGPRLGFTVPRSFGKAVLRNRAKRRIRELLRVRLSQVGPQWDIVINPRRAAVTATSQELCREVDRLVQRCGKS